MHLYCMLMTDTHVASLNKYTAEINQGQTKSTYIDPWTLYKPDTEYAFMIASAVMDVF